MLELAWPLVAVLVFAVAVRLSSLFSGIETGFYRVSLLKVSLDARAGDRQAERLQWFKQRPANFVATTLIGNNVANSMISWSMGALVLFFLGEVTAWVDIAATFCLAPLVFLMGELMPKTLYFLAPQRLVQRDLPFFMLVYWLFLPITIPLVWLTRGLERASRRDRPRTEQMLGRHHLIQVAGEGEKIGVLQPIQNDLVHGIFDQERRTIASTYTPNARVTAVPFQHQRDDVLRVARELGSPYVVVRDRGNQERWVGYYDVCEVMIRKTPLEQLRKPLPDFSPQSERLAVLIAMRNQGAACASVSHDGRMQGIVTESGITEHLFSFNRTPGAVTP